jgi:hypothetical protein
MLARDQHSENFQPHPRLVAAHLRDCLFPVLAKIAQLGGSSAVGAVTSTAVGSITLRLRRAVGENNRAGRKDLSAPVIISPSKSP